jgi:hypothetical protein
MQAVTQSTSQWVNHSRLRMFCPGHARVTGDGFFGLVFGFDITPVPHFQPHSTSIRTPNTEFSSENNSLLY